VRLTRDSEGAAQLTTAQNEKPLCQSCSIAARSFLLFGPTDSYYHKDLQNRAYDAGFMQHHCLTEGAIEMQP